MQVLGDKEENYVRDRGGYKSRAKTGDLWICRGDPGVSTTYAGTADGIQVSTGK